MVVLGTGAKESGGAAQPSVRALGWDARVPAHLGGYEHAQDEVRPHPVGQAVMNGAHVQLDGLERAEGKRVFADVEHEVLGARPS